MYIPQDNVLSPLYVVSVVFNPMRFKRRWKLYRDFQRHIRESGAILVTVEAALGEREFAIEKHGHANIETHDGLPKTHGPAQVPASALMPPNRDGQDYIKVRVNHQQELWLKENMLNLAAQHLPPQAKYVAFVDADVQFTRPDWVSETLHALQHYHVVQMFSTVTELSPAYEPHQLHRGFAYSHVNASSIADGQRGGVFHGRSVDISEAGTYLPDFGQLLDSHGRPVSIKRVTSTEWHPGYAWAWRREALDYVGGLVEHGILGAGDRHMACALIGKVHESLPRGIHPKYLERLIHWQRRAREHINGNVGFVEGNLLHFWHGRKVNRKYFDRWRILVKHQFNPDFDIKKDWRGVIALTDKKPELRDDIRRYFRARHEDSIDMPDEDDHILGPAPGLK